MHITMISRYKTRSEVQKPKPKPKPKPNDCVRHAVILCAETIMDSVMYVRQNATVIIHYLTGSVPNKDE